MYTRKEQRRFNRLSHVAVFVSSICCLRGQAFLQPSGPAVHPGIRWDSVPPRRSALSATRKVKPTDSSKGGTGKRNTAKVSSRGEKDTATKKKASTLNGYSMLDHQILTFEEEQELGKKIRKAIATKETIATIVEEKNISEFERTVIEQEYKRQVTSDLLLDDDAEEYYDDEAFEGLSVHALDMDATRESKRRRGDVSHIQIQSTDDYMDELLSEFHRDGSTISSDDRTMLTDGDIKTRLGISGGREEVSRILIEGAKARDKLISSNIRLVLSIAKKWCHNSSGVDAQNKNSLYGGSWTRPSLEEAIQEGILGLAKAADRYDYKRKLKFGTYATYWITNYVRNCFHSAATGSLRVPVNYHGTRQQYQRIVKEHYERTGEPLSMEKAAEEMGLTLGRLEFILKTTEPLVSLDAPLPNGLLPAQAGKSGSFDVNDAVLSSVIACPEQVPEDRVEMSLLRQCLENAMATELSPHERDVLRLRHGLDDGVSRSVREVVDILGTLTAADVRKSENTAFRKLRSPYSVHTYNLLAFLDYVGVDYHGFQPARR